MSRVASKEHHPLYADLAGIVGEAYTSDDKFVRLAYSLDTSPGYGKVQGIVVRPAKTEQVVEIVNLANLTKTPIIPSGGRASYMGVAPGLPGRGIVVDMTRMNKILSIDEENLAVTAEAGITTAELNTRVVEAGWDVNTAVQPWYTDTIGGQLSGMIGGGTDLDIGSGGRNTHHTLGVKVVLPNGTVLNTGAGPGTNVGQKATFAREPGGPDLTGMFIGDAGVFGIKVEITYRMYRPTKLKEGIGVLFDTFDEGWEFFHELSEIEPLPYCLIAMAEPTPMTGESSGVPDKYIGFCVVKGNTEEEIKVKLDACKEVVSRSKGQISDHPGVVDWVSQGKEARRYREMGEFGSPGYWTYLELIAPRSEFPECYKAVKNLHEGTLAKHNISYRSNLTCVPALSHQWIVSSIIWLDGWDHNAMAVMRDLFYQGYDMGTSRGWFPNSLQGYAAKAIARYWSPGQANFMRTLKQALDPNGIMNPGLWNL